MYDMQATLATELEGTQIADLTDTFLADTCGLNKADIAMLRSLPPAQLSSAIPLVIALGKARADAAIAKLPFQPELSTSGKRRCVYVDETGTRCDKHGDADVPICKRHQKKAIMLGSHFGSPRLRETFKAFHEDPNKMNCTAELALMRTMLASLLGRITDDNLNIEIIGGVAAMCDKITVVIERIGKIEKVTPEHLNLLMTQMAEVASKYIEPEKLEAFAADVEAISLEPDKISQRSPYMPGNDVDVMGVPQPISVQKRALIETANRMGIAVSGE